MDYLEAGRVKRGAMDEMFWPSRVVRQALLPDDSVPRTATEVRPGEHITVEIVSQWTPHSIAVAFDESTPVGRSGAGIHAVLAVDLNARNSVGAAIGRFKVEANGQNVTIRDD